MTGAPARCTHFNADGEREIVARIDGLLFSIDWLPDGELVATTPNGVVKDAGRTPYGTTGQPFVTGKGTGTPWCSPNRTPTA